jgi:hypothetical protein
MNETQKARRAQVRYQPCRRHIFANVFIFKLIILFTISIFGQTDPNYSGTWVINKIISQPDDKLQTATLKMIVTQTPTQIKIGLDSQAVLAYIIGSETTLEVESSGGKTPLKLKAELTRKGKFILNSQQTFKTGDGDISVKIKETFELSSDGNLLNGTREIQNSKGLPIFEAFIAKKEPEENTQNQTDDIVHDAKNLNGQFSQGQLNGKAKHLEIPPYPGAASANRVTGVVPVRVIFNEEGKVIFAQAIYGHPLLKTGAVESAMKCTFEPVNINGRLIKVSGIILYYFGR